MEQNIELKASQLVKLYLHAKIIVGNLYYAPTPEARLLDALNGIADMNPVKQGKFLELNSVYIEHADGRKEKQNVCYVSKMGIELAVTLGNADAGRGIGARPGIKSYPFVEKSAVLVRIETQDYVVSGNMYQVNNQQIWYVLENTSIFLPITHAEIITVSNNLVEKVPFVAVNRENIIALREEGTSLDNRPSPSSSDIG